MLTYTKLPNYRGYSRNNNTENPFHKGAIRKPAINIAESNESFRIDVAAPGYNRSDFNIEIENNELKISASKRNEINNAANIIRAEFDFSSFERKFILPDTVDSNEIEAKYNNGILLVNIPKKEEHRMKPSREIPVN